MFSWGIIAVILFILDIMTSNALLIGFAISALITFGLSIILPLWAEVAFFIIVGTILTIVIIPKLRKVPKVQTYSDSLEGVTFKASTDMVANELYQEKVKGTFWNIKCTENITTNQTIKIIKVDKENNCLIVEGE